MKTQKTIRADRTRAELIAKITEGDALVDPPEITHKRLHSKAEERKLLNVAYNVALCMNGIVYVHESEGLASKTVAKGFAANRNAWLYDLDSSTREDLINILKKIKRGAVLIVGSYERATQQFAEMIAQINEEMGNGIVLVSERPPESDGPEWQQLISRVSFTMSI